MKGNGRKYGFVFIGLLVAMLVTSLFVSSVEATNQWLNDPSFEYVDIIDDTSTRWFSPIGSATAFDDGNEYSGFQYVVPWRLARDDAVYWQGLDFRYSVIAQPVVDAGTTDFTELGIYAWCWFNSLGITIRGIAFFSDGSYNTKEIALTYGTEYVYCNFTDLMDNGKELIAVAFCQDGMPFMSEIYLDSATLLSGEVAGTSYSLEFTVTRTDEPTVISYDFSGVGGNGFVAYDTYAYNFSGTVSGYAGSGVNVFVSFAGLTNGTHQHELNTTITDGEFTFVLPAETSQTYAIYDYWDEYFVITLDDTVSFFVYARWYEEGAEYVPIDDPSEGGANETEAFLEGLMNYVVPIFVILLPALILVIFIGSPSPWLILIGITIGVILGRFALPEYVPEWLIFAIIICDVGFAYKSFRE